MRFLQTAAELCGNGDIDVHAIALYTRADRGALFVRLADEGVDLDAYPPADAVAAKKSAYLDYDRLLAALEACRADAVWVGWGFVAEDPLFAAACEARGIIYIGPSSASMARLSDKIEAKQLAEKAGVPVAPWSGGAVQSYEAAAEQAERIGFPLFVKSAAGGGGMGIREVAEASALEAAFDEARREALRAFGDDRVFLESRVDAGRHIEVQILADRYGTVWPVGVRECSIQRRRQKVVEESGFSVPAPELQRAVEAHAVAICKAAGYVNAGTVEFLVEPATGDISFMEVNTRLQVEHTVTEETTGLDLVREQIMIALGHALPATPPVRNGYAIEVRLNAEDPDRGFAAAPGTVLRFRAPRGAGVRTDTSVEQGDEIAPGFDSMIAKVIAWGPDRTRALQRLRRAMDQTEILVRGGTSNRAFLREVLAHPDVLSGAVHTRWLDERLADGALMPHRNGQLAVLQSAIEEYRQRAGRLAHSFLSSAVRGAPEADFSQLSLVELDYRGERISVEVQQLALERYRLRVTGICIEVEAVAAGEGEWVLRHGGRHFRSIVTQDDDGYWVDVEGVSHRVGSGNTGAIRATLPGIVVALSAEEGQLVQQGDVLLTIESMKLESQVIAPSSGVVTAVMVSRDSQIGLGQELLRVDSAVDAEIDAGLPKRAALDFSLWSVDAPERTAIDVAMGLVLGFDGTTDEFHGLSISLGQGVESATIDEQLDLLGCFADLHVLAPKHISRRSTQEHLMGYLRRREYAEQALSESFFAALGAALAHYGIDGADADCSAKNRALLLMYRSLGRLPLITDAVGSVLLGWLREFVQFDKSQLARLEQVLGRLAAAADGHAAVLSGLLRSVGFRYFFQDVLETGKRARLARVVDGLRRQADETATAEPASALEAELAHVPWEDWVAAWATAEEPAHWDSVLALIVSSMYRDERPVIDGESIAEGFVVARTGAQGTVIAVGDDNESDVPDSVRAAGAYFSALQSPHEVTVEYFMTDASHGLRPEKVRALLAYFGCANRVNLHSVRGSVAETRVLTRSFEQCEGLLVEQPQWQDLHQATRDRLELWRLSEFALTREAAPVGTWLFSGVSRENSRDQRLFSFAEVHDLTNVRDQAGNVTSVPALELALVQSLSAVRQHDLSVPGRSPYGANRASIVVDAEWVLELDVLRVVAEHAAYAARGLAFDEVLIHLKQVSLPGQPGQLIAQLAISQSGQTHVEFSEPGQVPVPTMGALRRQSVEMRRRGLIHPWDVITRLTSPMYCIDGASNAAFTEYDLLDGKVEPVQREAGENTAAVVFGVISNPTAKHPEGLRRVVILNDPSKGMASLGETECSRILAALELAERLGLPVEWYAVSSGARVAMESGTENLDWTARVLRSIIEMTQRGHEINVIVTGVNVGAQSYWNAEATMLMHTRGILVVIGDNAMVLTGKQALDYSGAVSAESNAGIGGYDRIMGSNGQGQYWAGDLAEACQILFKHYEVAYVAPDESTPRRKPSSDSGSRSMADAAHLMPGGSEFTRVGDIFDERHNPDRKKPFDIRSVMRALVDAGEEPMERWAHMLDAENVVVWDSHVGGHASSIIGIESHDLVRRTGPSSDGPARWSAGTLFPLSSKKVARALNAASGVRPVVILANLSGFDGSPESMRQLQLEYGAEIGRAVVNFAGPIVFTVISRYHGGAFVVFSKALNDGMLSLALEGAKASVIGGAPAAAVVFARDVERGVQKDPRITAARAGLDEGDPSERALREQQLASIEDGVRSAVRGTLAREFDDVHTVERALAVGSIDKIVSIASLREEIVEALCTRPVAAEPSANPTHADRSVGAAVGR
ncbi:carboxyl transferase domain-containing protein [Pseudarthrobacter sp. NIBRBAC000502772]|uniref:ATP-binding protein n=1 Tax=Pseudarthrobacter sp. NIBRBAC000502772 TaxID=2590775 RepID=UPI00143DB130|nr:carboxyl transferase domain-containing protein [Pseudarthrobacter sp. NIBRBAC000502772]